ncbi:unnamed protein product [Cochlearia groenlandica]
MSRSVSSHVPFTHFDWILGWELDDRFRAITLRGTQTSDVLWRKTTSDLLLQMSMVANSTTLFSDKQHKRLLLDKHRTAKMHMSMFWHIYYLNFMEIRSCRSGISTPRFNPEYPETEELINQFG